MYTREDTIRSDRGSELGRKTVGIQDQWVYIKLVIRMNNFEVSKLRPTKCMGVIKSRVADEKVRHQNCFAIYCVKFVI